MTMARPVITLWVLLERERSIAAASFLWRGLPRILFPNTTIVSAPIIVACGWLAATSSALARARFSANRAGVGALMLLSSTWLMTTRNFLTIFFNNCRRRGEAEAKMIIGPSQPDRRRL